MKKIKMRKDDKKLMKIKIKKVTKEMKENKKEGEENGRK